MTPVWHDGAAILVNGSEPLPSQSLYAELRGEMIWSIAHNGFVVAALEWSQYCRQDGSGFANAAAALAYLQGEYAKGGATGPAGATGPQGVAGPAGAPGPAGAQGVAGVRGDTGPAGPQGLKGDTGAVGPVGPKGDQGTAGAQGAKGDAGATGATGAAGSQGAKGDTGTTGPAGLGAVAPAVAIRALNTTFQPHATKAVRVSYSVKTQVTNPLLVGTSTATVTLLSDAATTPTTERGRVEASSGVGITVTIAMTTSNTAPLTYIVPPGHNVRLVSTIVGTGAATIVSQVEEVLG